MSGAKCVYILTVATGLALVVIWQSTMVRSTGYQVARLEEAVRKETSRRHKYNAQITKLKSPKRILRLKQQLGIPLVSGSRPRKPQPAEESEPPEGQSGSSGSPRPEREDDGPSMEEEPLSFPSTTARSVVLDVDGGDGPEEQESSDNSE